MNFLMTVDMTSDVVYIQTIKVLGGGRA